MSRKRIEVLHGVNLDQLGKRDPDVYGTFTLAELETRVHRWGYELDCEVTFWQTNHEGEYCETLHEARDRADGLVLNPGAWTHYSYAIRDALDRWEPRVVVETVEFGLDEVADGRLIIDIGYRVRATNTLRNLVYPFYVIPAEELE